MDDAIFPRRFNRRYPNAARGQGVYLFDETGKRYLDACGGAAVVTIGHGVPEVVEAIRSQAAMLAYAHSSHFHTRVAAELADWLRRKFPGPLQSLRVHFTSGGSEATETAIKIVRQYWISRGQPQRSKFVSRWHGYHGATLGALALSGNRKRREAYLHLLPQVDHISACFCYRCPLGLEFPACNLACACELAETIERAGPDTVAAFILEPIVGATSGAVPPDGYLRLVREICDTYGILLIADEIITGAGRTGAYFAVEHWGVVPDLLLLGKGLSSGYAPLGAVVVSEKVCEAIRAGSGTLEHGLTYQGHPPSMAAGLAVQQYLERHRLVEQARARGEHLARRLESLRELPSVGDVRSKGLLQTVELVADKTTRQPFPPQLRFSERLAEELRERGALVYPMSGTADGASGDHIMIAPPFVIEEAEIDWFVEQLHEAIERVHKGAAASARA